MNTTDYQSCLQPMCAHQQEMVWLKMLNFLEPIHKMWYGPMGLCDWLIITYLMVIAFYLSTQVCFEQCCKWESPHCTTPQELCQLHAQTKR